MNAEKPRYKVVFTPVGWQVVDTVETGDPVAEFGTGDGEYNRAKERCEIEQAAREAGPWTQEAEEAVAFLRDLSTRATLTDAERRAFDVLRQREINEAVARRRTV